MAVASTSSAVDPDMRQWPDGKLLLTFDPPEDRWDDSWSWRSMRSVRLESGLQRVGRGCQGILVCSKDCGYTERPFVHTPKMKKDQIGRTCKSCGVGRLQHTDCKATSLIYKNAAGQVVQFEHSGSHPHARFSTIKRTGIRTARENAASDSPPHSSPPPMPAPLPPPPALHWTPRLPSPAADDGPEPLSNPFALRQSASLPAPLPPPSPSKEQTALSMSRRGRGGSTAPSTPRGSVVASTSAAPSQVADTPRAFAPKLLRPSQLSPQAKRMLAAEGITVGDDGEDADTQTPAPPPFSLSPATRRMAALKLPSDAQHSTAKLPSDAQHSTAMSRVSTTASSDPASPPTPREPSPPAVFSPSFETFASDVFGSAWSDRSPAARLQKRDPSAPYFVAPDQSIHDF